MLVYGRNIQKKRKSISKNNSKQTLRNTPTQLRKQRQTIENPLFYYFRGG